MAQRPEKSLSRLITCKKCSWSYSSQKGACPMCGEAPAPMTIEDMAGVLVRLIERKGILLEDAEAIDFLKKFKKQFNRLPDERELQKAAEDFIKLLQMSNEQIKAQEDFKKKKELEAREAVEQERRAVEEKAVQERQELERKMLAESTTKIITLVKQKGGSISEERAANFVAKVMKDKRHIPSDEEIAAAVDGYLQSSASRAVPEQIAPVETHPKLPPDQQRRVDYVIDQVKRRGYVIEESRAVNFVTRYVKERHKLPNDDEVMKVVDSYIKTAAKTKEKAPAVPSIEQQPPAIESAEEAPSPQEERVNAIMKLVKANNLKIDRARAATYVARFVKELKRLPSDAEIVEVVADFGKSEAKQKTPLPRAEEPLVKSPSSPPKPVVLDIEGKMEELRRKKALEKQRLEAARAPAGIPKVAQIISSQPAGSGIAPPSVSEPPAERLERAPPMKPVEGISAPPPDVVISPAGPSGASVKCPSCSADNPPGSKFCLECGVSMESPRPTGAPKDELACPACKNVNPVGSRFCLNCGNPLI